MAMRIPTWFAIGRMKRGTAAIRLSTNPLNSDRIKCLRMVKSSQVVPAIVTVPTASVNKKGIFISFRKNSNLSISFLSCHKITYYLFWTTFADFLCSRKQNY